MTQRGGRKHFNYVENKYESDPKFPENPASTLESDALNLLNINPSTINNSSFISKQFYNLDDADKLKVIGLYNKAIKKRDKLDKKLNHAGHIYYTKELKSQVNSFATIKKHATPQYTRTRKISEPSAPSVSGRHHRRPSQAMQQVTKKFLFNDDDEEVIKWISNISITGGRKKNKKTKKLKNGRMNTRRSRRKKSKKSRK